MRRNDWKCLIDALLFVDVCSIAAIGLIMAFIIPEGRGGSKYFLGLHRHDWGDIHIYLSLFLLVLLALHVWSNWTWVMNSTKSYFGERWKKVLWSLAGAWVLVLLLAWLIVLV